MGSKFRGVQIKRALFPSLTLRRSDFRTFLKDAEEESCAELHRLTQTLLAYESVGMGFDSLVEQYTALMAEIDNKKWALSELRQTQDNELDDLWNQR